MTKLTDLGSYYTFNEGDSYFVFTLGACERCGGDVQEANGLNVHLRQSTPEQGGLKLYGDGHSEPAEVYPDDERGGYCCDQCYENTESRRAEDYARDCEFGFYA